jgi:hypothetical protein
MRATEFQMEVLGRVADDYEAIHTIRGDMERDLARSVSEKEVASALLGLVALGFVDCFVYDAATSKYREVAVEAHAVEKLWFLISKLGRSEYENYAV